MTIDPNRCYRADRVTISENVSAKTIGKREALNDFKKQIDLCFVGDDGKMYWHKGTFESFAQLLRALGYREDMKE